MGQREQEMDGVSIRFYGTGRDRGTFAFATARDLRKLGMRSNGTARRGAAWMKRKIEFSSHTGNLALMRSFVRTFLEQFPFSDEQRTLMVLGVDEACTNIIRHAYQLREDQLIALSLEGLSRCVRMRLRDYGKQPPGKRTPAEKMSSRPADLIKPGGLGLHMIHTVFDQVDYVMKSRGTELVLTKNLSAN